MKKLFLGMMLGSVVLLTSCGPSVCDCIENAKKGGSADMDMAQKCVEKFKDYSKEEQKEALNDCK
jgi:hypothetical protein